MDKKIIIFLIVIILILGAIFAYKILNKEDDISGTLSATNTLDKSINTNNKVNSSVENSKFIENLKEYFTGKKVASVKLSRNTDGGKPVTITQITDGLKAKESDIEISNNSIKVMVAEDMIYEWNYKINNDSAEISIKKSDLTAYDKIVLVGNINHLSTIFVAYTELLGINPKEALAYWHLAIRDINKNEIDNNKITIDNKIFSTTEENTTNGSYSFVLKINNKNISDLPSLLEVEKTKESTTTFVGY